MYDAWRPPRLRPARRRTCAQGAVVLLVVLTAGCGAERYRDRVARTASYYEYLQQLDLNLSHDKWTRRGIQIRVPRQFQPIPIEERPGFEDRRGNPGGTGQPADPAWPGLIGVWTADVAVEDSSSREPAFLYLASRRDADSRGDGSAETEGEFERDFVQRLASAFGQSPPAGDAWGRKAVPEPGGYVEPKTFRTLRMSAPSRSDGPGYELRVYSYRAEGAGVIVAFAIPQQVAATERLTEGERIGMCLQTLEIASGAL